MVGDRPPIEDTLAEMDFAGVSVGMLCAWHGPSGPMISNDEVAQFCRAHPDRFSVSHLSIFFDPWMACANSAAV